MVSMTDTFDVPQAVRNAAKRGLEMRRKYGRGGLDAKQAHEQGVGSGVQRASDLISGKVSYRTIKRMAAFFSRHRKNKDNRMDNGEPSAGMIAWAIWGGDAGDRWSRSVISREEGIKKGSFSYLLAFGDVDDTTDSTLDDATDSTPVEEVAKSAKPMSFSELLVAARPKPYIPLLQEDQLMEVADDYEYQGVVLAMEAPADAIPPEEPQLTSEQVALLADAQSDVEAEHIISDVSKSVVEIDLMEDYVQPTKPVDPEAPTEPPEELPPEPQLQVVVDSESHSRMKKSVKQVRGMRNLPEDAMTVAKNIMKGAWSKVDMFVVQKYIQYRGEHGYLANAARAVGGEAMAQLIEKAKVPEKYLEGLSGEERAKRKKFIENRNEGKHTGDKYKEFPSDKGADTKPSKYSKTAFASKVREEMKGNSKAEFISAAAKISGISSSILEQVYRRGSEAWATSGHRVGASQEAWARARVYSFCVGGKTQKTADKDLWEKHKKG